MRRRNPLRLALSLVGLFLFAGCMSAYKKSVGADLDQVATKAYVTDMNGAWQATLDALKSTRLDVSNRDSGYIQTRWVDNTAQKNFADGAGSMIPYMSAKVRYKVNLSPARIQEKEVVKISVQKEQLIQKDALEDFRPQESNLVEERTLLYRIGRIIAVKSRLAREEQRRLDKEMKEFDPASAFGTEPGAASPEAPAPEEPLPEVAP